MNVSASARLRCNGCFFIRRKRRLYVNCKVTKKHKARQG